MARDPKRCDYPSVICSLARFAVFLLEQHLDMVLYEMLFPDNRVLRPKPFLLVKLRTQIRPQCVLSPSRKLLIRPHLFDDGHTLKKLRVTPNVVPLNLSRKILVFDVGQNQLDVEQHGVDSGQTPSELLRIDGLSKTLFEFIQG